MPDIDEIITTLSTSLLPAFIQFVLVLFAVIGTWVVAKALYDIWRIMGDRGGMSSEATIGGSLIRMFIGGLMVVPSAVLWRAAAVFISGGSATETNVLAYISGDYGESYCEQFGSAITLIFIAGGVVWLLVAARLADDQARGFDRNGYRLASRHALGALGCIFITDLFLIIGKTTGMPAGFPQLCTALGGG